VNKYRSKYEKRFAEKCTKTFAYEALSLEWVPPVKVKKYTPDFIFQKKDGGTMMIETKGVLTTADREKMKCVKEQHPEKDIRFLFQRASNKIRKGSKTSYSDWAEKNGFKWAEGEELPLKWLKEIA